jgi:outer membrane lipoprotein carrier protein
MPDPTRDDAPAPTGWKVRLAVSLVVGLTAVGLVLGVVHTVALAMGMFGKFQGFHPSARLVPVATSETPSAPVDIPEETPTPEPVRSVAPPPALVSADAPPVDAGHDTGHDAVARAATPLVDTGADMVINPAPRRAHCNADIARQVDAFYARTASFRSRFEQELGVRALNSSTRSRGSLLVAKPGRMSWTYDDPEDSRIVSDGQTVSVYEAPNKHLFRVPVQSSPYPGAFAFLTGQASLGDLFDFAWRVEGPDEGVCVLMGTPRSFTRAYRRVLLYVDRVSLQVGRVVIVDRAGDENRIDLIDPSFDVPVADDAFTFTPPPDTIVVGR